MSKQPLVARARPGQFRWNYFASFGQEVTQIRVLEIYVLHSVVAEIARAPPGREFLSLSWPLSCSSHNQRQE